MTRVLLADGAIDLRLGRWQDVLADVEACDAVITDPPFSARTHEGQRHGRKDARHGRKDARYCDPSTHPILSSRGFNYSSIDESDVHEIVGSWHPRAAKWMCFFTSHDLVPFWEEAGGLVGRYVFGRISCVQMHRNVRLQGDGPSNWSDDLVPMRPVGMKWRALDGAYVGRNHDDGENSLDRSKRVVPGGKPLWLMRRVIADYTDGGDLVVDPFGGGFTTAVACALDGRRCISCEVDPATFEKGVARVRADLAKVNIAARQVNAFATAELRAEGKRQRRAKAQDLFGRTE